MTDISTLKADLAAEHARYSAELERDIQKLFALARLVDAERELHELGVSHEQT